MVTYSKVEFGLIPHDHWYQPDWIDEDKASKSRKEMEEKNVIYGGGPRLVLDHGDMLIIIQGVSHIATCVGSTLGSSTATSYCRSTDTTGVSSKPWPFPLHLVGSDRVVGPTSNTSAISSTTHSCLWKNITKHIVSIRQPGGVCARLTRHGA